MRMPSPKRAKQKQRLGRDKRSSPRRNSSPPKARKKSMFTFIDLFAGIGGMRQAFDSAGGRCVFTSEYDSYAVKTYQANFPGSEVHGDITKIDPSSIPNHDVLVAGFPCQPFSIAGVSKKLSLGRKHGFEDPTQGTLFFNVKEIIATKRPRAFLLENVKNLVSHDGGRTFAIIRDVLENQLGYSIHARVLDGRAYVPQHRERIIIVGFRELREFQWPTPPSERLTLDSVLLKDHEVESKYTLSDKLWSYLQGYAAKHKAKGNGFGFGLVGRSDVARTLSARYYKDGSEILIKQETHNPRRLTPRECANLMGFRKHFKIPVSDTRAYKQFGNSVVVPLVEAVACEIVKALDRPALRRAGRRRGVETSEQLHLTVTV